MKQVVEYRCAIQCGGVLDPEVDRRCMQGAYWGCADKQSCTIAVIRSTLRRSWAWRGGRTYKDAPTPSGPAAAPRFMRFSAKHFFESDGVARLHVSRKHPVSACEGIPDDAQDQLVDIFAYMHAGNLRG